MKYENIKKAAAEAKRFLSRVNALHDADCNVDRPWTCPKEMGAIRRASMDLTRALAEMRRP